MMLKFKERKQKPRNLLALVDVKYVVENTKMVNALAKKKVEGAISF